MHTPRATSAGAREKTTLQTPKLECPYLFQVLAFEKELCTHHTIESGAGEFPDPVYVWLDEQGGSLHHLERAIRS